MDASLSVLSGSTVSPRTSTTHINTWGLNSSVMDAPIHIDSPQKFLHLLLTDPVLEAIVSSIERARQAKISHKAVAASDLKYYKRPVTKEDFLSFYGMVMHLENTRSPMHKDMLDIIREYRDDVRQHPFGIQRFRAILSCVVPSDKEFENVFSKMRESFQRCWTGHGAVSIDETCTHTNFAQGPSTSANSPTTPSQWYLSPESPIRTACSITKLWQSQQRRDCLMF